MSHRVPPLTPTRPVARRVVARGRVLSLVASVVASIVAVLAAGCSSPSSEPAPNRADGGGHVLHEWSKVISVRSTPAGPVRKTVGFLDRRFTLDEPDGTTYVLDHLHEARGFVLAAGDAFLIIRRGSSMEGTRDLGKIGLESGIKRILGVRETVELEPIPAR